MPRTSRVAARLMLIAAITLIASLTVGAPNLAQDAGESQALVYEPRAAEIHAEVLQALSKAPEPAAHILRQPCISPDGETLVFIFDGDIWRVNGTGGTARRLTVTEGNEWSPVISPDNQWIAFRSERYGSYDLYVMPIEGGQATRISYADETDIPCCWLPDGSGLIFASARLNHAYDLWIAPIDLSALDPNGAEESDAAREPWPITAGGFRNSEFDASISPDGKTIAYTRGGGYTSYRRRGYTGASTNQIWLCDFDGVTTSNHRAARATRSNNCFPRFVTNDRLVYVSFDANITQEASTEELGYSARTGRLAMLGVKNPSVVVEVGKRLPNDDVRDPSMSAPEAGVMVFGTGSYGGWHLYRADIRSNEIKRLDIKIASGKRGQREQVSTLNAVAEYAPSPDGKLIAFTSGYDVFLTAPGSKAEPVRITETVGRELQLIWSPDGTKLIYAARRDDQHGIYEFDLKTREEKLITPEGVVASHPGFVPGGDQEAPVMTYIEDETRIVYLKAPEGGERVIAEGRYLFAAFDDSTAYSFSPKGRWIAHTGQNDLGDAIVLVTELATGEEHQVSRLFQNAYAPRFSSDGTHLAYLANQEGSYDVYLVELEAQDRKFAEDELDELLRKVGEEPAKPEAKKPETPQDKPAEAPPEGDKPEGDDAPEADPKEEDPKPADADKQEEEAAPAPEVEPIDFERIQDRTRRISTMGGNESDPQVLAKGEQVFFIANDAANKPNIFQLKLEQGAGPSLNQFSRSTSGVSNMKLSADGKWLWFKEGGKVVRTPISKFAPLATGFTALRSTLEAELRLESFNECAEVVRRYYYDTQWHGLPLEQVVSRYRTAIEGTWSPDEWGSLMNEFLGELNSSHQGFTARDTRSDGGRQSSAGIGLEFDPISLSKGEYIVSKVLARGPCDHPEVAISVGDKLLSANGVALDGNTPLSRILLFRAGKRVVLEVQSAALDGEEAQTRSVAIRAISPSAQRELYYGIWVDEMRAMVHELSGGRLGYAHVRAMNGESLNEFKHELGDDMESREAVLIDVRFNGGGSTAVDLLEILIKRPWLKRYPRGTGPSGISENIYRSIALEKPSLLLINEQSFSNAEIMAEGFRRLQIGSIVGEETAGGVIGTSSFNLIDGSRMRMPFSGAFTVDGENLENNGRKPDMRVLNHPDELDAGVDAQIKAAVEQMLKELDG